MGELEVALHDVHGGPTPRIDKPDRKRVTHLPMHGKRALPSIHN